MKKQKMLITLAGLVAAVATVATIKTYTLAGDGPGTLAEESLGAQETAFDVGGPTIFELGPGQISDDGGSVFIDNPVADDEPGEVHGNPPLHGDPPPKEDVEDPDDQAVRVGPGTGLLIDPLLATGAEVKLTGEVVKQPFFSVGGTIILVDGERVQVMEYREAAALEAEAAHISPDGSSTGTTMVMWVSPPHFFRTETAIVLYVGENPEVIEALRSVLGTQFAGQTTPVPTPSEQVPQVAENPAISHGMPEPSLAFEGVKYTYSENFYAAPDGEESVFSWPGAQINADDMEAIGTTTEANTHWPGEQRLNGFLKVYRLKSEGTTDVYTFTPVEISENSEDGKTITTKASWTRWTAN